MVPGQQWHPTSVFESALAGPGLVRDAVPALGAGGLVILAVPGVVLHPDFPVPERDFLGGPLVLVAADAPTRNDWVLQLEFEEHLLLALLRGKQEVKLGHIAERAAGDARLHQIDRRCVERLIEANRRD